MLLHSQDQKLSFPQKGKYVLAKIWFAFLEKYSILSCLCLPLSRIDLSSTILALLRVLPVLKKIVAKKRYALNLEVLD